MGKTGALERDTCKEDPPKEFLGGKERKKSCSGGNSKEFW